MNCPRCSSVLEDGLVGCRRTEEGVVDPLFATQRSTAAWFVSPTEEFRVLAELREARARICRGCRVVVFPHEGMSRARPSDRGSCRVECPNCGRRTQSGSLQLARNTLGPLGWPVGDAVMVLRTGGEETVLLDHERTAHAYECPACELVIGSRDALPAPPEGKSGRNGP